MKLQVLMNRNDIMNILKGKEKKGTLLNCLVILALEH